MAGVCLCGPSKLGLQEFVGKVSSILCGWCSTMDKRRLFPRILYDEGHAVVRVMRPSAKGPSEADLWLYLGFGNLRDGWFYVLRLVPREFVSSHVRLMLPRQEKPRSLWSALAGQDLKRGWGI